MLIYYLQDKIILKFTITYLPTVPPPSYRSFQGMFIQTSYTYLGTKYLSTRNYCRINYYKISFMTSTSKKPTSGVLPYAINNPLGSLLFFLMTSYLTPFFILIIVYWVRQWSLNKKNHQLNTFFSHVFLVICLYATRRARNTASPCHRPDSTELWAKMADKTRVN